MATCDSSVFWADIQGKPETFPPAPHTHVPADIVGLEEFILQYIPDVQPIIIFSGDPDRAPLEGESIVSINEATGEIFGWNGSEWLAQREVDIGAVPPVAAPTFGNRLYLEVVNDNAQIYAWDGDEWIALGGVSLTDNADGTYTYTDTNGTVTIDTRAQSNPIVDAGNYFVSGDEEGALQEVGASLAALNALSHQEATIDPTGSSALTINGSQSIKLDEGVLRNNQGTYEYVDFNAEVNIDSSPQRGYQGTVSFALASADSALSSYVWQASVKTAGAPVWSSDLATIAALNSWVASNVSGTFTSGTPFRVRLIPTFSGSGNQTATIILAHTQTYV